MIQRHPGFAALLALLASTGGCAQSIIVGVDPGDGGTSGTTGTYTSEVTGPRSGMVAVQSPDGVTYYIDSTEVSQADYEVFLQSDPQADPSSSEYCASKTTFAPGYVKKDYYSDDHPDGCRPDNTHYDPVAHGDLPVVCVDWCDAVAYCRWAGKRLCGRIGGGRFFGSANDDFQNPNVSQWFNACSNGGTTAFPYGNEWVTGACNAGPDTAPVGQTPGCHGAASPFDGVFDMSGNVAEWEDNCEGGLGCIPRGGGHLPADIPGGEATLASEFICGTALGDQQFGVSYTPAYYGDHALGFRCCAD